MFTKKKILGGGGGGNAPRSVSSTAGKNHYQRTSAGQSLGECLYVLVYRSGAKKKRKKGKKMDGSLGKVVIIRSYDKRHGAIGQKQEGILMKTVTQRTPRVASRMSHIEGGKETKQNKRQFDQ